MSVSRVLGLGAIAMALSSCSYITVMRTSEFKAELARVEANLQQSQQKRFDSLQSRMESMQRRQNADLSSLEDRVYKGDEKIQARLEEVESALGRVDQQVQVLARKKPKQAVVPEVADSTKPSQPAVVQTTQLQTPPVPVQGVVDDSAKAKPSVAAKPNPELDAVYEKARADFGAGKVKDAFKGFRALYEKDEVGLWHETALFWMAQCYELDDKAADALKTLDILFAQFANGNKFCAAKFQQARLYALVGEKAKRKKTLEELASLQKCPNEAALAIDLLKEGR